MAKYKLVVYGAPAVGKSVFASKWGKPFFICTDDNYDFLEPFGAKPENHIKLHSWTEFKTFIAKFDSSKYDTIVVDLMEDLYLWCEYEYLSKNKIEDLSDMGYGKGYKIVRNDFAQTMLKVINMDCNFVGLTHEDETHGKTNRGLEYVEYAPSSLIPEKCWTLINGRLRFCFRAYLDEHIDETGKIVRERRLSVSPKAHEFQINRGLDVNNLPEYIPLDYDTFCNLFGKPDTKKFDIKVETVETPKIVTKPVEKPKESKVSNDDIAKLKALTSKTDTTPAVVETPKPVEKPAEIPTPVAKPVEKPKPNDNKQSGLEQLAKIKAMLEAKKNGGNN